ncbi:MAG: bacterio-opsin activator [Hydrogenothermaceae bacterium]
MIVIGSAITDEKEIEHLVTRVFFKSVELLGGMSKLAEYRTLTWLPSLARASYVIVLKDQYMKTDEEIAEIVGLTKNTVRNILRADPELALRKIKALEELIKEEAKELRVHTAGGVAKLAYREVKEGREAQTLIQYCSTVAEDIAKTLDIPWAYLVLKKSKGVHYPITDSSSLKDKLHGVPIKGVPAEEVISKLHYPIKNPAELIHEIKQVLLNQ